MSGRLVSTRDKTQKQLSYTDVLLEGLASDGGLYIPTEYPQLPQNLSHHTYPELALTVKSALVGDSIPKEDLQRLINAAYTEEKFGSLNTVPIRNLKPGFFIQNLSLGPTAAFKDMALQQLGQEMNYELNRRNQHLTILGATSGDTGSAAEAAVKGLERIKLFMLSPQVGMSVFQQAQMGALTGDNIYNISINGPFDDCQDLVKGLKYIDGKKLGAVNSINWGRISSQVPYFVSGYLQSGAPEVDFVVPSGNFGNVLSGYIAKMMGIPIRRLIVATNENNVLDRLIQTGEYRNDGSQITSSPSMDISKASNYERLAFDLLGRDPEKLSAYMREFEETGQVQSQDYGFGPEQFAQAGFFSGSSTHQDRLQTIRKVYLLSGSIIDPHTADAVKVGLEYFDPKDNVPMIAMETALPVKFQSTIDEALGMEPERDPRFVGLEENLHPDAFYKMDANPALLEAYIRARQ